MAMTDAQLRARARELMAAGVLFEPAISVGGVPGTACAACGGADHGMFYRYPRGEIVRMHSSCRSLWRLEREAAP